MGSNVLGALGGLPGAVLLSGYQIVLGALGVGEGSLALRIPDSRAARLWAGTQGRVPANARRNA